MSKEKVSKEDNIVPINSTKPQKNAFRDGPRNGDHYQVYSFNEKEMLLDDDFKTVPRNKRQRGKLAEAQRFRKAQGAYLRARMHFFDISQRSTSQLAWWFANTQRIRIHHHILGNYYLEDRPTPVVELIEKEYCSVRALHSNLNTAVEMGSIEIDSSIEDKRQRVIYPTRGFIADTDNLFGRESQTDHGTDGMFVFWAKQIDEQVGPIWDRESRYSLKEYHQDFERYNQMVAPYLPDTNRQF